MDSTHTSSGKASGAPGVGMILALWLAACAAAIWALLVMLGHTTTQGHGVPATGIVLAFAPVLPVLWLALVLLRRAQRDAPFGLRMWACLPPLLLAGYLLLAMLTQLVLGR